MLYTGKHVTIEVNGVLYHNIPITLISENYGEFGGIVIHPEKPAIWVSWYSFNEDDLEALVEEYIRNTP